MVIAKKSKLDLVVFAFLILVSIFTALQAWFVFFSSVKVEDRQRSGSSTVLLISKRFAGTKQLYLYRMNPILAWIQKRTLEGMAVVVDPDSYRENTYTILKNNWVKVKHQGTGEESLIQASLVAGKYNLLSNAEPI